MSGIVLMVLGLVVPGCSGFDDRDKSGTTGCAFGTEVQKTRENKPCRDAVRETAERAGDSRPIRRNPRSGQSIRRNCWPGGWFRGC